MAHWLGLEPMAQVQPQVVVASSRPAAPAAPAAPAGPAGHAGKAPPPPPPNKPGTRQETVADTPAIAAKQPVPAPPPNKPDASARLVTKAAAPPAPAPLRAPTPDTVAAPAAATAAPAAEPATAAAATAAATAANIKAKARAPPPPAAVAAAVATPTQTPSSGSGTSAAVHLQRVPPPPPNKPPRSFFEASSAAAAAAARPSAKPAPSRVAQPSAVDRFSPPTRNAGSSAAAPSDKAHLIKGPRARRTSPSASASNGTSTPRGTPEITIRTPMRPSLPPLCSTDSVPPELPGVILNAANIGFEYGTRFNSTNKLDWTGVEKAVRYYLKRGIRPEIVCQKRIARNNPIPEKLQQYVAQAPALDGYKDVDDLLTILLAMRYNCQLVDNDNYRDWLLEDKTLSSPEIRNWLKTAVEKQSKVLFTFTSTGSFMPLIDPPAALQARDE